MRFLILILALSIPCFAQFTPRASSVTSLASTYNPVTDTWVSYVRADEQAGADGAAITTVTQTAGSAASYTGTCTLRTGANGINGHNALSFNGSSNILSAATGGASLATDFYAAAVVQHSSLTGIQNYITFGSASSSQRRSLAKGGSGYHNDKLMLLYQGNDLYNDSSPTIANSTAYLVEMTRQGNWLRLYLNGAFVADGTVTLNAYAGTAIKIGGNLSSAELFAGLMAEVAMASSLNSQQINSYRAYVSGRYGITISSNYGVPYVSSGSVTEGSVLKTNGQKVWMGPGRIYTAGTLQPFSTEADFSLSGNLAAIARSSEHMFANQWDYQNTAAFWNRSPLGLSAIRFLYNDDGNEMCALGYAPPSAQPWGETTYGSMYLESANFHDTTQFGSLRFIQTKNTSPYLRLEMKRSGDWVFYRQNGSTATLTIKESGVLNIANIPTSSSGLSSGDVYSNAGILTIVP